MIVHPFDGNQKMTPREAARQLTVKALFIKLSCGVIEEEIRQQFPDATEREIGLIYGQAEKIIERINK